MIGVILATISIVYEREEFKYRNQPKIVAKQSPAIQIISIINHAQQGY